MILGILAVAFIIIGLLVLWRYKAKKEWHDMMFG